MKFFIDTEFIESGPGKPIQLISIGMVSELGAEYYAISSEFAPFTASEWVKANVLAGLEAHVERKPLSVIAKEIQEFVFGAAGDSAPEFWGYYSDYDWVVFCQIFGTMMDLPKGFPMYCRDLKQWCDESGSPTLPKQESAEHNALSDAKWNLVTWNFLLTCRGE